MQQWSGAVGEGGHGRLMWASGLLTCIPPLSLHDQANVLLAQIDVVPLEFQTFPVWNSVSLRCFQFLL